MKKIKINVDRPVPSSKEIEAHQNFEKVLIGFKKLKSPIWKNPWIYASVGGIVISSILINQLYNKNSIKETNEITENTEIQLPEDTKCIHSPIEKQDLPFQNYKIEVTKNETIILSSGTEIYIPEGSIIPNSTSNQVEIKIREFRTESESFIAGIPMDYKSTESFESAGMIEIRGSQNNKEVTISPQKPIEIKLNLTKDPTNFQFWKLNEKSGDWKNYSANFSKNRNAKNQQPTLLKLENELSQLDHSIKQNEQNSLNTKKPERVTYNLPLQDHQQFDLAFDIYEFPELEKFKGMEFEVVPQSGYDKTFTKKAWTHVDLTKEDNAYFAVFSSKKNDFKIQIRPVLTGQKKDLAEQKFAEAMIFYTSKKEELAKENKTLLLKKQVKQNEINNFKSQVNLLSKIKSNQNNSSTASFNVTAFGVYNCDKPTMYPKAYVDELMFTYSGKRSEKIVKAYIFDDKNNVRFSFGENHIHSMDRFGWFDKNPNTLIAIDSEGHIGYVQNFNSSHIKANFIQLNRISSEDDNIEFLKKIISETVEAT